MGRLHAVPLLTLLGGLVCLAMVLPAGLALAEGEFHDARSFFYAGVIGLTIVSFIALAQSARPAGATPLGQLRALLGAFLLLPVICAVPFFEAVRTTSFLNAYFEMVSAFTTTGAAMFDPARLSDAEHLWRALVGWMGGLLMWVAAAAILAPLALGGFEITASGEPGQVLSSGSARGSRAGHDDRVARAAWSLTPVYAGLTLLAWVALLAAGDTPLIALCHAMSVMATSGISPLAGLHVAPSGYAGEVILFVFMGFALTRLTFSGDTLGFARTGLWQDAEFRLGVFIVLVVPFLLFVRHWIGAFELTGDGAGGAPHFALWGSLFTVMSFLTTTGFESAGWSDAQAWSGLSTPGMILMGLALIGGGVATTAGGVKLLRVYALYLNGAREIERLIHPSSVGRATAASRRLRREGAFFAWVFFMLVAMTIAAMTALFALAGVIFENAVLLSIATLANTGPLLTSAAEIPFVLAAQSDAVKLLMCLGMVLGRLEMLAIIVMLTPDAWRD